MRFYGCFYGFTILTGCGGGGVPLGLNKPLQLANKVMRAQGVEALKSTPFLFSKIYIF